MKINKEAAIAHLKELGYAPGDNIYIRCIHPKQKGNAINLNKLKYGEVEKYQEQGYDIYFVVNGGGHKDQDVQTCRAIFYEHDNLSKDIQRDLWQQLGLPQPTIQVDTGGKSIHSYWVLKSECSAEEWRVLQTDLLEFADADRTLKNPSRILRLAGSWYMKSDEPTISQITTNSGVKYKTSDLRAIIPVRVQEMPRQPNEHQIEVDIPLENCLTLSDRALIESGANNGERNAQGLKLACNLIATANYLRSIGQRYEGDERSLFDYYCRRCPDGGGWNEKEWDAIWKSANLRNPQPSLTEEQIKNCIVAWNRKQNRTSSSSTSSESGKTLEDEETDARKKFLPNLRDQIANILDVTLTALERKSAFICLSKEVSRPLREIEQISELLEKEFEQEESRIEILGEVDKLLAAKEAFLDIHRIAPAPVSQPLAKLASWLNLKPEVYLTTLLTVVSTLHKVGTKLLISEASDFEVSPNLFTGLVAESSQKKSPILKAMVYKPLRVLQTAARDEYLRALERYQIQIDQWNSTKGEERVERFPDGKPKEPRQKIYYMSGASGEGLVYQMQSHPKQGILYIQDELAGIFKSANMYRQGKGSDEEDLLSLYDGSGMTIVRAAGVKADLDETNLGVLGSIQPSVLQSFMQDCSDSNGKWARFIFVQQPNAPSTLPETGQINLNELLIDLYKKVDSLPPMAYHLSKEAFNYYRPFYQQLEIRRVNDSSQGMRSIWGKAEGRIGKLAINLHVIHELMNGVMPSREIPKARIVEAVELTNFYIQQIKALHVQFTSESSIAPCLAKVVDLSKQKGWIKTRDVQRCYDAKSSPSPNSVRNWFMELQTMGRGKTQGKGRTLKFHFVEDSVEKNSTSQKQSLRVLEPKVEFVEFVESEREKTMAASNVAPISNQTNLDTSEQVNRSSYSKNLTNSTNSTTRQMGSSLDIVSNFPVENFSTENSTNKVEIGDNVTFEDGSRGVVSHIYNPTDFCVDFEDGVSVMRSIDKVIKKERKNENSKAV